MPRRRVKDWITSYLEYTDNTEPPTQYHLWCAISALAGALQRRVWLVRDTKIYPNQYVILVGASGYTRKGTALGKMRQFFRNERMRIRIPIESGNRVTKEQLVRDLSEADTTFRIGNIQHFQYTLHHIVPEMVTFLGHRDILLLGWLTDWYDSDEIWENKTKTAGIDTVINLCYNFIGATAPDWVSTMLPSEALGGGFTSRCIFVFEERKRKVVTDTAITDVELQLQDDLLEDLLQITTLTGQFELSPKAFEIYEQWYENQETDIVRGVVPIRDPRLQGYVSRRQTHAWKLAMALSVSRSDELVIKAVDIRRAITILTRTERKMSMSFGGTGTSFYARAQYIVGMYLRTHGRATRAELLAAHPYDLDHIILEAALKTLNQMGKIATERIDEDGVIDFRYTFLDPDAEAV